MTSPREDDTGPRQDEGIGIFEGNFSALFLSLRSLEFVYYTPGLCYVHSVKHDGLS
jgi:hypothetical protein